MKKTILALLLLVTAHLGSAEIPLNDTDYLYWGTGSGPVSIYGSSSRDYLRCQMNGADIWGVTPTGLGLFTNAPAYPLDVRGAAAFGAAGTQATFSAAGALTLPSGAAFSGGALTATSLSVSGASILTGIVTAQSSVTVTGARGLGVTYGISAATASLVSQSGGLTIGQVSLGVGTQGGVNGTYDGAIGLGYNSGAAGQYHPSFIGDLTEDSGGQTQAAIVIAGRNNTSGTSAPVTMAKFSPVTGITMPNTGGLSVTYGVTAGTITASNTKSDTVSKANAAAYFGDASFNTGVAIQSTLSSPYGIAIQGIDNASTKLPLLLNSAGGNVGIGTASPSDKLHVSSPTTSAIIDGIPDAGGLTLTAVAGSRPFIFLGNTSGNLVRINATANKDMQLSVNGGSNVVMISSNGGVGFFSRTIAQLQAITPTQLGEGYYCNNCSPLKLVISTGSGAGNFADPAGGTFK